MLRKLSIVIIIMLLFSVFLFSEESKTDKQVFKTTADRLNPTEKDYPGGRATDMIVIYTPEFGERTGTNQWGVEATIVNGIVTKVGGNDSEIPKDGFVISGHGIGADWIREHLKKGAIAMVKGKKIKVQHGTISEIYDVDSVLESAENYFKKKNNIDDIVKESEKSNKATVFLGKKIEAEKLLTEAKKLTSEKKNDEGLKKAAEAKKIANDLFYDEIDSKDAEIRGVWHRLTEKSPEELIKTLDRLKEANFNAIFPEAWYHGMTIYPSEVVDQLPEFQGWDPLKVLVEEGKKRGIEVHVWVESFFVGVEEKRSLKHYKNWLAVRKDGKIISELEKGYIYLCPARKESQELVLNVYKEMVKKYAIDGLQLDYVRYPRSMPYEKGYCYCEYCQKEFKKLYGVNPLDLTPEGNPEMWENWRKWREDNITRFVETVIKELKAIRNDIEISAAVFPEYESALTEIMQNWKLWTDKGWFDFVCPMIYSDDKEWVDKITKNFLKLAGNTPTAPGIAPFMKIPTNDIIEQILVLRDDGTAGVVMFALHSVNDDLIYALKRGPFKQSAKTGIKIKQM
jgi:uncharacterized lipoprotein YddW (UPF0748 family)